MVAKEIFYAEKAHLFFVFNTTLSNFAKISVLD